VPDKVAKLFSILTEQNAFEYEEKEGELLVWLHYLSDNVQMALGKSVELLVFRIVNAGNRLHSPDDNHLLGGWEMTENYDNMRREVGTLIEDFQSLKRTQQLLNHRKEPIQCHFKQTVSGDKPNLCYLLGLGKVYCIYCMGTYSNITLKN